MRNWNKEDAIVKSSTAPFRSYLWGIETIPCCNGTNVLTNRLDLTYEELKQCTCIDFWRVNVRLDLTYEELKLLFGLQFSSISFSFRSYLWGIETYKACIWIWDRNSLDLTYEELKLDPRIFFVITTCTFRSYLWGIETPRWKRRSGRRVQFRSYLWGIETEFV